MDKKQNNAANDLKTIGDFIEILAERYPHAERIPDFIKEHSLMADRVMPKAYSFKFQPASDDPPLAATFNKLCQDVVGFRRRMNTLPANAFVLVTMNTVGDYMKLHPASYDHAARVPAFIKEHSMTDKDVVPQGWEQKVDTQDTDLVATINQLASDLTRRREFTSKKENELDVLMVRLGKNRFFH